MTCQPRGSRTILVTCLWPGFPVILTRNCRSTPGRESNRRAQSLCGKILLPRFVSRLHTAKNRLEYLTRKDRARLLDRRKPVAVEKGEEVFVFARFLAGPA